MGSGDAAAGMAFTTRDGGALHVERHGQGTPIVVFEAGMGSSHHAWGAVVPAVARRTTTVAYDRSGLGRSPHATGPRDLERLVGDLVGLLDQLGSGPFVLVGHSWGGPIVRGAAARSAERVAGLVLVDASDEGCDAMVAALNERIERLTRPVVPVLARLGVVRWGVRRLAAQLPEPAATGMRREDGTLSAMRTHQAEVARSIADLRRLRDHPEALPEVPVTIVSGGRAGRMGARRRAALVAAHRARAESLPHGRHVVAERSGHYVPFTEPDLVAGEILRIIDGV